MPLSRFLGDFLVKHFKQHRASHPEVPSPTVASCATCDASGPLEDSSFQNSTLTLLQTTESCAICSATGPPEDSSSQDLTSTSASTNTAVEEHIRCEADYHRVPLKFSDETVCSYSDFTSHLERSKTRRRATTSLCDQSSLRLSKALAKILRHTGLRTDSRGFISLSTTLSSLHMSATLEDIVLTVAQSFREVRNCRHKVQAHQSHFEPRFELSKDSDGRLSIRATSRRSDNRDKMPFNLLGRAGRSFDGTLYQDSLRPQDTYLTFHEGDFLYSSGITEGGWALGRDLRAEEGWFPDNYLELFTDPIFTQSERSFSPTLHLNRGQNETRG